MPCSICCEHGHNSTTCWNVCLPLYYGNDLKVKNTISKMDVSIIFDDIKLFYNKSSRSTSDEFNKKRELIICELGNNELPEEWINSDKKWETLYNDLNRVINTLNIDKCEKYKLTVKGGRSKNYDLELSFYNSNKMLRKVKLEFKYGANEISDCPQWVSPMYPSQYFDKSYEELYYDKYLPKLCQKYGCDIPDKSVYLKEIHNNKPSCMLDMLFKYYKGSPKSSKYTGLKDDIDNYNYAKQVNNESIKEFLETSIFNVEKMNTYLQNSQKDKKYLLWNNGSFNIREKNVDDYTILNDTIIIKNNNSLVGKTKSGCVIKLLFRWKNGVAYPALQIS